MEWTKDKTQQLIELFKEKRELWDPSDVCFKDRSKKHDAWASMGVDIGLEASEVEKKMRILIGQFYRELKKGQMSDEPDSPYKSKWNYFKPLFFLKDKRSRREPSFSSFSHASFYQSSTLMEDNSAESGGSTIYNSDLDSDEFPLPSSSSSKRVKADTTGEPEAAAASSGSLEHLDAFGEFVAGSLKSLKSRALQSTAKFQISKILFLAEMASHQKRS